MYRKFYFFCLIIILNFSCGLKTFYDISPPMNAIPPNDADGGIVIIPTNIFEFTFTARDLSTSSFSGAGTDVYYRIYDNQEDLLNDGKSIYNANDDDTNNGFKVLDTLGYKELQTSVGGKNALIPSTGGRVIIRLDVNDGLNISVSGTSIGDPLRWNNKYFNFDPESNIDDIDYALPEEGDDDFEDSDNKDDYYYVNAYAVSIGYDSTTFEPIQSELLSLGFIAYERN